MDADLPPLDIQLNPAARVQLRRIGNERQPLLIIDDVLLNAKSMVDNAALVGWAPPNGTYYPGLNAPLPSSYLKALLPALRPSFERAFSLTQSTQLVAYGFYALATWGLERFGKLQRIPHYDQVNPAALAMVHYLCKEQAGGTAFFRHDASGFESITEARRQNYMLTVADELERDGDQLTGFAGPETPNFSMIDKVEMHFNRAVIYPSNLLHCALFDDANLTQDPRTGRLTANSFFAPL